MSNSVVRLPDNSPVPLFAGISRGVEYGFIAAGVTVAALAALQSVSILVGWIAAA